MLRTAGTCNLAPAERRSEQGFYRCVAVLKGGGRCNKRLHMKHCGDKPPANPRCKQHWERGFGVCGAVELMINEVQMLLSSVGKEVM